jgi:hypothetical protein
LLKPQKIYKKKVLFFLLEAICGRYLNDRTSSFTSPHYPKNYINNLNCTWVINVDIGLRIILSFDDFSTQNDNDYVEVFDGSSARNQSIWKFSGSSKPSNLISSSNSLTVFFKTDGDTVYKGFSAEYGKYLHYYDKDITKYYYYCYFKI